MYIEYEASSAAQTSANLRKNHRLSTTKDATANNKLTEPRKLNKKIWSAVPTNFAMRVIIIFVAILCAGQAESQFWKYPQQFFSSWLRQGKTGSEDKVTTIQANTNTDFTEGTSKSLSRTTVPVKIETKKPRVKATITPVTMTVPVTTIEKSSNSATTKRQYFTETTETASTFVDTTTHEVTATSSEHLRENQRTHDFYLSKREKPQIKIASNISQVSEVFSYVVSFFKKENNIIFLA